MPKSIDSYFKINQFHGEYNSGIQSLVGDESIQAGYVLIGASLLFIH